LLLLEDNKNCEASAHFQRALIQLCRWMDGWMDGSVYRLIRHGEAAVAAAAAATLCPNASLQLEENGEKRSENRKSKK